MSFTYAVHLPDNTILNKESYRKLSRPKGYCYKIGDVWTCRAVAEAHEASNYPGMTAVQADLVETPPR